MASQTARALIALPWLLRVRWVMVAGQAVIVAIANLGVGIDVPVKVLAPLILASAVSNLVAYLLRQRLSAAHLGGSLLLFDVVQLTGLLSVTGGPLNPFSMIFLVYITLAAVVLGARWTWTIATAAALGFAALFVMPGNEHSALAHAFAGELGGHLQGMWWAFAAAAALTALFVVRLSREIDDRDRELAAAQARAARTERLASLTTLAAGAAHELGTPLATIAVAAGELERTLADANLPDALDDARLIRAQLDRARDILNRLGRRAGDPPGEMPQRMSVTDLVGRALTLVPGDPRQVDVRLHADAFLDGPPGGLSEAIAGLIRNAIDAGASAVSVTASVDQRLVTIVVQDTGAGIPADVLAHVGEPFFTTKSPGAGLGLGVFLARLLANELGGDLTLTSTPGSGTTATLRLPSAG
ncbi:MAG: hypothetical protein AMXMBFR57_00380 [Acidimicrobiia bacterium]|jgi:two-component system sensor histidine kinase RegB